MRDSAHDLSHDNFRVILCIIVCGGQISKCIHKLHVFVILDDPIQCDYEQNTATHNQCNEQTKPSRGCVHRYDALNLPVSCMFAPDVF